MKLDELLQLCPVIPVIVIERATDAVPLATALVRGGLRVLEVTLRTPAALDAMRAMAQVEGAIVGAGTALSGSQYDEAVSAGARFVVSPGFTDALAVAAAKHTVPWLPGVATASEVMRAREAGLKRLKFFPAEPAGGVPMLRSFAAVFQDVRFCPTGGINEASARSYLALPNVACIGGSWLTPADALASGDFGRVERLAAAACRLRG
jgi:2-dehydro-3-deoxyphosphogluconate aldolase/(4S)-4-hydroxy-2-oxoglutarate aldolase